MDNENEVLHPASQEIRTVSDKSLATLYLVAGAIVAVLCPFIFHSLLGWVLMVTGVIFAFLGICGFVTASQDAKRQTKKD